MKKITMKTSSTVAETFEDFLISKKARGLSDKTLKTYKEHFNSISRYLQIDVSIDAVRQSRILLTSA